MIGLMLPTLPVRMVRTVVCFDRVHGIEKLFIFALSFSLFALILLIIAFEFKENEAAGACCCGLLLFACHK